MLISVDTGKRVTRLPHKKDFNKWMSNLSAADYKAVVDDINAKINASDINTAGWLPGHNWDGTVYEALYDACGKNQTQAGMFFGLLVFQILMDREDHAWGFGKYEKDGVPIASMTYFILKNIPERD